MRYRLGLVRPSGPVRIKRRHHAYWRSYVYGTLFSTRLANADVDLQAPVQRVLDSHRYILGEEVAAFEREYANYLGVEYCVGVANGPVAINIALRAVGVTSSDCALVTPNAGFYSSTSILQIGAC
ncbi:DegT/DnrJ/EryC1/StrS aminotransferase family protein [Paraburkholderia silvatlantica]|nr:DegT/DnrJ/EryC1/StrS aminotransferase family protein [Paraburkholderia silvatlantica]